MSSMDVSKIPDPCIVHTCIVHTCIVHMYDRKIILFGFNNNNKIHHDCSHAGPRFIYVSDLYAYRNRLGAE